MHKYMNRNIGTEIKVPTKNIDPGSVVLVESSIGSGILVLVYKVV